MARVRLFHPDHNLVHVSFKCVDDQFLLVPSQRSRFLVASVLRKTMEKYTFELFAICAMGNHVHMVLRYQGSDLAKIMQFFKSRLAMEFNALLKRSGAFWKSRYRAQPILDDPSFLAVMHYVHANPVRAHLVEHAKDWPGLSSYSAVADGTATVEAACLNEDAWMKAGRPKALHQFIRRVILPLAQPPQWRELDASEVRAAREAFVARMRDTETEARRVRLATRMHVPTLAGLSKWNPRARPATQEVAKPQPWAFGTAELVTAFRSAYRITMEAYKAASARFRASGILCPFPLGTFPPRIPLPMEVM